MSLSVELRAVSSSLLLMCVYPVVFTAKSLCCRNVNGLRLYISRRVRQLVPLPADELDHIESKNECTCLDWRYSAILSYLAWAPRCCLQHRKSPVNIDLLPPPPQLNHSPSSSEPLLSLLSLPRYWSTYSQDGERQTKQACVLVYARAGVLRRRSWSRVRPAAFSLRQSTNWLLSLPNSASGFTTRSDIGPAREGPSAEAIAYVFLLLCSPAHRHRSLLGVVPQFLSVNS